MNYIDEIAERIYRVNDPDDAITCNDMALFRLYAVLCLAKGEQTEHGDVHDAWSAWRCGNFPEHPDLVPFGQLTREKQDRDDKYVAAIHVVTRELAGEYR